MADSSLARGLSGGADLFADDDPLAELARIAGYDEKVQAAPSASAPARREPSFNLEDELLREFERYDSPRQDLPREGSVAAPVAPDARQAVVPPLAVAAAAHPAVRPSAAAMEPSAPDVDPFLEPGPELPALDSLIEARPSVTSSAASVRPAVEPALSHAQPVHEAPLSRAPQADLSPLRIEPSYAPANPAPSSGEPVIGDIEADLVAELETSLSAPAASAFPRRPAGRAAAYEPGFRMPLVNFSVASRQDSRQEPSFGAGDVQAEADHDAAPSFVAPIVGAPSAAPVPSSPVTPSVADLSDVAPSPVSPIAAFPLQADRAAALAPADGRSSLQRPVNEALSLQDELARSFWGRSTPEAAQDDAAGDRRSAPVITASQPAAPVAQDTIRPVAPPVSAAAQAAPVSAPSMRAEPSLAASPAIDPIDDEFELMLDDLDLDEIMMDEPPVAKAPVPEAPVAQVLGPQAPVARAPVPQAPVMSATPAVTPPALQALPVSEPAQRPQPVAADRAPAEASTLAPEVPSFLAQSRYAPQVMQAPVAQPVSTAMAASVLPQDVPRMVESDAPVFAAQAGADAHDDDAFDPAQLTEAEDMPEAVAELDVPELPVHEPEQPVAEPSDYDLDLDAELASYLESTDLTGHAPAAPANAKASEKIFSRATAVAASVAAAASFGEKPAAAAPVQKPHDELDDFERALEEDFRRSLATPLRPTPVDEALQDSQSVYPAARRSLASFAMPLAAAGFAGIVGISLYAWYASGTSPLSGDGSPVVIAADTDPVKMVPDNPGGKTVPNQDKAVYDRVASGTLGDPKQASLISSEEQPVDVVQKTLTPEGLPLEGEDEAQELASLAGDTQDPRLLPDQAGEADARSADRDQLAVMPRRVKTMIVRPDGTLVEQVSEEPATGPIQASATPVTTEKLPAAPQLAEPTQLTGAVNAQGPSDAPTNLADVDIARTTAMTGEAVAAPAGEAAAAQAADQSGVPAPNMPVPTARPAEQPVQVVASVSDRGTIRQTVSAPAAASAAPAAAASPAVASAAGAPAQNASAPAQSGGYFMQIASLPSEADAQKSYRNLSAKFAGVIGGRGVDIAAAQISNKGTFYRVRIPAGGTRDEAAALCERYRAAGGTCLIAR
ncbi:SPOR domain-containing protein [Rhizobium sp. SSA_523]|uniref:SPOR domain-containing protein n=1 Tax=Rhizobium sp. SSA_523 TaxID=2952477 RepID=UPI002091DD63|nr:SPOR domain-containing protein [Rhizobium sp. SSA_523]MCO5734044.1 SPOR domain-containing protein [Rhizobium sp. SSA_523]WKC24683.1 SPOR domain-containing protein [Rhizobium sp. SSA_523]